MSSQIGESLLAEFSIFNCPKPSVAAIAKERTDLAGGVVVVNVALSALLGLIKYATTNGALAILRTQYRIVLRLS